jgi:hypothetical protein
MRRDEMNKVLLSCLAGLMAVTLVGPASAQPQYKANMKLASALAMDHPYMLGAQK